jgi:hypothetical protein
MEHYLLTPWSIIYSLHGALFTHSMEQSPSWEANSFADSQEIPRILLNPEISLPHSQMPANFPYPEPDSRNC